MEQTLARINAAFNRRLADGRCVDFQLDSMSFEVLEDDTKGVFLRIFIPLTNGEVVTIDTLECQSVLLEAIAH